MRADAAAEPGAPLAPATTRGRHLLLELRGCNRRQIADVVGVESALRAATRAVGATVLSAHLHRFEPQGVSGVLIIAESHLSIHTWPEVGYAAVDLYTCGAGDLTLASDVLVREFGATDVQSLLVERGLPAPDPSLRLLR